MARYSASGSQTLTSSAVTALSVASDATTAHRTWVYEFWFGNVGTPADQVSIHTVQRITATGTSTGVTPTKMDAADRAAQAAAGENHTGNRPTPATKRCWKCP